MWFLFLRKAPPLIDTSIVHGDADHLYELFDYGLTKIYGGIRPQIIRHISVSISYR